MGKIKIINLVKQNNIKIIFKDEIIYAIGNILQMQLFIPNLA